LAVAGATALVAALLVGGTTYLWHSFWGELGCEVSDSNFGEYRWAWWPMGRTCQFSERSNGFSSEQRPGWSLTVVVLVPSASGAALLALAAARRRDD
jgi:hypothetical protein